ncbi:MAG: SusC/RagA family TonB-linked outer membrane protein [Thermoflavifilum sp.]|uniref:SusC/RagA family TonB-linked outer membrane protein n=1 Tax=Thermoflavifilum sp. TaxID=1968839 RepID=UPI0018A54885|nr:SusC/RagA family TonB-linked outer membrane protein [Thermoflavifilum sp.]QOR76263.1 MAG: SusC/RagA family TonB-linked outer membrane protein [Thermoflavifilum sp.]
MKKALLFLTTLLFSAVWAFGQQRTITGKVVDQNGNPIPYATVQIQGTNQGTTTDQQGNFSLEVPAGATLRVSYVGYTPRLVAVGDQSQLTIQLAGSATQLNELVVTALGIQREKRALGYSVQDVTSEQLTVNHPTNPLNELSGKVSGLQIISASGTPGSAVRVQLRGATSILGDNQPLFVVDGIPVDNSENRTANDAGGTAGVGEANRLLDLNPDDIESITVLKGPAASALYGSQASNGAIIITTKRGGPLGRKTFHVTYNLAFNDDQVNKLPDRQNKFAQGIFGTYLGPDNPSGLKAYSFGPLMDTMVYDGDHTYLWDSHGRLVPKSQNPNGQKAIVYDPYKFFQHGVGLVHNLAFSGSDRDISYRVSLSHSDQSGVIPLSKFKKSSISINTDYRFTPQFSISSAINYVYDFANRPQQGSNLNGVMLGLLRTPPSFDNSAGVTDPTDPRAYMLQDGSGRQRSYRGTGGYDNPYWTVNMNPFTDKTNRIFGNVSANYMPFKWLTVTERFGGDYYIENQHQIYSKGSSGANAAGAVFEDQVTSQIINHDFFATAHKQFGKDWDLSLMLGNNIFQNTYKRIHVQGTGLNFNQFQGINNTQSQTLSLGSSEVRRYAFYSRFSGAYKDYVYLDLTGRLETSSTLPINNNTYFYPSANLSFIFTQALKMNSSVLSFGKIRASFAQVGKDLDPYSLQTYWVRASAGDGWTNGIVFPFGSLTGFQKSTVLGNSKLKAEKTSEYELGTELHFFGDRIYVDYTFYHYRSTNLLNQVSIANSTGYGAVYLNAADMENYGHEVTLNLIPLKFKDFTWNLTVNWATNQNKVLKLGPGIDRLDFNGFAGIFVSALVGKPYGVIYGTGYVHQIPGDVKSPLVIYDQGTPGDGQYGLPIISNDLEYLGNTNPKWTGSLGNTFTWKGISLYVLFEARQKYQMWNGTWGAMTNFGVSKNTENRYTQYVFPGVTGHYDNNGNLVIDGKTNNISVKLDENYYTGVGSGFAVNEPFVQDASWVRLREISIGYTFQGNKLFKQAHPPFESITVSLVGRNLWLHTKYTGVDPETSLFGSQVAQGFDYFNNPGVKTYGFNLNFRF